MKLIPLRPLYLVTLSLSILGGSSPGCRKSEPAVATPTANATAPVAPTEALPTPPKAPDVVTVNLEKVKGSWLRQDGGYQLVIGDIGTDGQTKAEYFNPNPIHVASTQVRAEGAEIKVEVELRDTNYPGCLYKLTYVPTKDTLEGTYFQAQMKETYDIEFVRKP